MKRLVRIDKNGTKYWADDRCPKCGGSGKIDAYYYMMDGVCFLCGGSGKAYTTWQERTPEYEQKLAERRLAKARKQAPEANRRFLERYGFSEDGNIWLAIGNTYEIKDELKEAGAKFTNLFGWSFSKETEYPTVKVTIDEMLKAEAEQEDDNCEAYKTTVLSFDEAGKYFFAYPATVANYIKSRKERAYEELTKDEPKSEWVGAEGDKIEKELTLAFSTSWTSHFGYREETMYLYSFKDEQSNVLIWKTCAWQSIEEGDRVKVKGTIKAHEQYKDVKQTILTRCKVEKIEE